MIAADLQVSLPLLNRRTTAATAGRLIVRKPLTGVVVADDDGAPVAVLSPIDVLRMMLTVRGHTSATPADAGTIGALLDDAEIDLAAITHVDTDDSLTELAEKMVSSQAQVALVGRATDGARFVTLPTVMQAILVENGEDGAD